MRKWIILFFILIIAAIIRLWQLGVVPPSPDWDEVALGYNAFSIMQTGKDEYGQFLPIILRSYDDYKPALYSYLTIPAIAIFGLSVYAVRLPSVIFGLIAVVAIFFLIDELFHKRKFAYLTSFVLAISPWSIQFSRIAFESNVGVSLNILSVVFFLKALKKPWLLCLAVFFASLSIYVYQSEKVFLPLLFIFLITIFRISLFRLPKKYILLTGILGIIFILPMVVNIIGNKNALARAQGVSIFAEQAYLKDDVNRLVVDKKNNDYLGLLLDNRRVIFAKQIFANYLSHFDFNWLFITGDITRHHAPNMGLLYLWELPFLLIGIYTLIFGDFSKTAKRTILAWFLLTPIPASVTTGVPHAVRALNFVPIFALFTSLGILTAFLVISRIKYQILKLQIKYLIFSLCFLFFIFNLSYFLNQYFVQQNIYNSKDWQYGYEQATLFLKGHQREYKKIIVSNEPPLDQSYMFFLFYLKYSPHQYQEKSNYASGGFRENHIFDKFEFRPISWEKERAEIKTLYIGRPADFSVNVNIKKIIYYLDGEPAIYIVEK